MFRSQTAPALLRGDIQPVSHLAHAHTHRHTHTFTHARTHTHHRGGDGAVHHAGELMIWNLLHTYSHMWWQSDAPSPSSRPPLPPLPPHINRRATCTPDSLVSGCLNEDIAAMVKDKAEDRTLQYQQTLVSFGWGHRWRLASCVSAWRDLNCFYFIFLILWMSLSGRGGCGCRLLSCVLCENRRRLCVAFIKYSYTLSLLAVLF